MAARRECSDFGDCPECGCGESEVLMLNVGRDHWQYCPRHKTRWLIGSNLFSSWRHETEADWQRNREVLEGCREVEPRFCQHCLFPPAPWYTRFRQAVTRRLRWLADCLDRIPAGQRTGGSGGVPF